MPVRRATPILLCSVALGACGSSSSSTHPASSTSPRTVVQTVTTTVAAPTPRTTTAPTPGTGGAAAPGGSARAVGLAGARAVLARQGFTPADPSQYHPDQTLRVLVGVRSGSGDGYGQRAFFFVEDRYLGTDASQPSSTIKVVGQDDTDVTLAYPVYRAGAPLCCPGSTSQVRFALDNGRLVPQGTIPPYRVRNGG